MHDFSTHTRSATLPGPTDRAMSVSRTARALLAEVDTSSGVRLLGVGVSGLSDWIQDDLFAAEEDDALNPEVEATSEDSGTVASGEPLPTTPPPRPVSPIWRPGMDVEHVDHGPGWVWGSGLGRVTVRFETAETGPGPVRTFAADDPSLVKVPARPAEQGTDRGSR
jgi:DNA polymerase-4